MHNTALDHPEDVRLDLGPPEGRVLGLEQLDEFVAEHLLQAGRGRVVHHSEVLANENEKSPSQGRKKKNHDFCHHRQQCFGSWSALWRPP